MDSEAGKRERGERGERLDVGVTSMDVGDGSLTHDIINAFHAAQSALRFGLPEYMCSNALGIELRLRGLSFQREAPIEVLHRGVAIGVFRLDLVVENQVIVEVKSAQAIRDTDEAQLLNYLRVSRYEVGLLMLFGIRSHFRRFVYSNSRKTLE